MALEIIPSIDLRSGKVVRLQQGDYARQINYDVDPIDTAKSFAAAGARWMHIVDLDGAKAGAPQQYDLIGQIARASGLRVEVGGGVRSREDIVRLIDSGVERVVVGTKAIEDWEWFKLTAWDPEFAGRIILALDAKDGIVATKAWTETSTLSAVAVARKVTDWPLGAILYTDVAKDGMLQGPNLVQTQKLAEAGKVPVIASGGVGHIGHIRELTQLGVWGAIVGRSLYEGTLKLQDALLVAKA